MLESIRNSIKWLVQIGALRVEKLQIKRNVFQTNFRLQPEYQAEAAIKGLFQKISLFSSSEIKDFAYV
jgi:hypothetical protein